MKMLPDISVSSPEFQAILTPLKEQIESLKQETQEWKQKYHHLLEQLRLSQQRQFARSSEANVLQGELQFDEAEAVETNELPEEDNTLTITYSRKKPIRRPLPKELHRKIIEHDISLHDKQCTCGCMKQLIGEEVTEQLLTAM